MVAGKRSDWGAERPRICYWWSFSIFCHIKSLLIKKKNLIKIKEMKRTLEGTITLEGSHTTSNSPQ